MQWVCYACMYKAINSQTFTKMFSQDQLPPVICKSCVSPVHRTYKWLVVHGLCHFALWCGGVELNRGCLWQNLHIKQRIKEMAYKSLVRPLVEYACAVWSPSTDCLKSQIEMTQRRAARFVTNNYHQRASVTKMLQQLNWESLEAWRQSSTLSILTKRVQGEERV
mgnify:CR=1 FL=1